MTGVSNDDNKVKVLELLLSWRKSGSFRSDKTEELDALIFKIARDVVGDRKGGFG